MANNETLRPGELEQLRAYTKRSLPADAPGFRIVGFVIPDDKAGHLVDGIFLMQRLLNTAKAAQDAGLPAVPLNGEKS